MHLLNHRVYGEKGPVIYILHGIFGMLDNWHYVAGQLSETCTVVTMDARNHGKSFHTPQMDFHCMAEDVNRLREHLGHPRIVLAGHSMGGKTAMKYAELFGDTLDKLVVMDIANKSYPPGHLTYFEAFASIDFSKINSRAEADAAFLPFAPDMAVRQFLLKNLEPTPGGGYKTKANIPALQAHYPEIIGALDLSVPAWDGPTLFMAGEKSAYIKESDKPGLQDAFPGASFITVSKAGHWLHADNPAEFLDKFQTFIFS